jgi:hypothetical protein
MVLVLTAASGSLGPELSGLLAPFPVVTSVLAAFGHAQRGPGATLVLLRGMLLGFFAFGSFCAAAAVTLPAMRTGAAFGIACGAALAVQAGILGASTRSSPLPSALCRT